MGQHNAKIYHHRCKNYTYDNRLNPLYLIDDLLPVFSEDYVLWEFFVSEHNSLTKYYGLYNVTINYENSYDNRERLVKEEIYRAKFDGA